MANNYGVVIDSNHTAVGFAGGMPDVRFTNNGNKVCNFRIADNVLGEYESTESGGIRQRTVWTRIIAFGALADYVEANVATGLRFEVSGSLREREYEHPERGLEKSLELVARSIEPMPLMSEVIQPELAESKAK